MSTTEQLVGLVGAGIGPSLSPPLHEREASELGLRLRYERWDIDVLGVAATAIGALIDRAHAAGYRGLNITHPCKQLVMSHLDALSSDAEAIGAVNTVVFTGGRAIGHNTDWSGFGASLIDGLPDAALDQVVLLGAGGAGAAVAHALLKLGTRHLTVIDVDHVRAEHLTARLGDRFGADRVVAGRADDDLSGQLAAADGLVHATPTGMAAHPGSPLPPDLLRTGLWVADIVYRPLKTELLRHAHLNGCRTLDGGRMAVHQAADAFALFTGVDPDRPRMLRHFAALVGASRPEETSTRVS